MSNRPEPPDEQRPPDDEGRWRRPADRFPSLPDETPPTAPLREPPRQRAPVDDRPNRARDRSRNLIALVFLLGSCAALAYFAIIWQNPYSPLNPLAPPTPLPLVITATLTATLTATPAPTETPVPSATPSGIPSLAPTLTFTPVKVEGVVSPTPTEDTSNYRFSLAGGRVIYITNPAARGACQWSSIAGSVTTANGAALNGYGVHVVGEGVDQTVATGSVPSVGPGGFEVALGNAARDATFTAQLIDPQGVAVSPVYTVETRSDCDLNIAKLLFVEAVP